MIKTNDRSKLSSTESTRISLEAIRDGEAGLNEHRIKLLDRVPNQKDWAALVRGSVSVKDIAYLSAATGDEFALLRGKTKDIIFHGEKKHCNFDDSLMQLLKTRNLRLVVHSHPDYNNVEPSSDDRAFLKYIGQRESLIISYITGEVKRYTTSMFEDI